MSLVTREHWWKWRMSYFRTPVRTKTDNNGWGGKANRSRDRITKTSIPTPMCAQTSWPNSQSLQNFPVVGIDHWGYKTIWIFVSWSSLKRIVECGLLGNTEHDNFDNNSLETHLWRSVPKVTRIIIIFTFQLTISILIINYPPCETNIIFTWVIWLLNSLKSNLNNSYSVA